MSYTIHAEIYIKQDPEQAIEWSYTDISRSNCIAKLQRACRELDIKRYIITEEYEVETA